MNMYVTGNSCTYTCDVVTSLNSYGALFESPPHNIYHLDRFSVQYKHDWEANQFIRVIK